MADNGGAAFPIPGHIIANHPQAGMSLRDWFAGQIIRGIVSNPNFVPTADFAASAYATADELIAARKKER